jgi:hypothetical protein
MKKMALAAFFLFLGLTFAVMAARADTNETEKVWSGSVSASVLSRYVGPSGIRYTEGPVVQTESTLSHESGLSLTLWTSKGFKSGDGVSDEVDFVLGYEKDWNGTLFSFGAGYYDFVRATEGNVWCLSAEMSRELKVKNSPDSLTPFVRAEVIQPASRDCPYKFSYLTEVGAITKLEFKGFDLCFTPTLVYDEGEYGGISHFTWRWELGAEFEVGGVTISPMITWFRPSEIGVSEEDIPDKETVVALKATYQF